MDRVDAHDYLSVREAATLLGVSPRAIYTYIQSGSLDVIRVGGRTVVLRKSDVLAYQRSGPGRKRRSDPVWRRSSHPALLITVTVPILAGRQWEEVDPHIEAVRKGQQVPPGVTRCGLACNQNEELELVLVCRATVLPPCAEERDAALRALLQTLKEYLNVFDWDIMTYTESRLLLVAGL